MYELWDFLTARAERVIHKWAKDEKLSKRDRVLLNRKVDVLARVDFELAIGTKLLAGPIDGHIYKLVIHGDVMLRPMLCRGPLDNKAEYTLLLGAIEKNWVLRPKHAAKAAEANRQTVLENNDRRRKHERVP